MIRTALIALIALAPIAAPAEIQYARDNWSGVPQARGNGLMKAAMVAAHEDARQPYRAPPIAWSDALAEDAMAYAEKLAATGVLRHDRQDGAEVPEGENLSMGTRGAYSYRELAQFWVDERVDFQPGVFPNVSRTGNWSRVGHYTQMVWPETQEMGCAVASNASHDFLVCRYLPAGNVVGVAMDSLPMRNQQLASASTR